MGLEFRRVLFRSEILIQGVYDEQLHLVVVDEDGNYTYHEPVEGTIYPITDNATVEYLGINEYTVLQVKTNPGTTIVFLGFILASIASILFCSGRYRELRIVVDEANSMARIHCYCKSPVIAEEMEKKLQERFIKGE